MPQSNPQIFRKPPVGVTVTFTTKFKSYVIGRDYDIETYENVPVLKSAYWDQPNTFRIPAVGEPYINQRVIPLKGVISMKIGGTDQTKIGSSIRVVMVEGSRGAACSPC